MGRGYDDNVGNNSAEKIRELRADQVFRYTDHQNSNLNNAQRAKSVVVLPLFGLARVQRVVY